VTIVHTTGGNEEHGASGPAGHLDKNGNKGPGCDSTVEFNPDRQYVEPYPSPDQPWKERPPAIGLGHELIHAEHDANGTNDWDPSDQYKKKRNGVNPDTHEPNTGDPHTEPKNSESQAVGLPVATTPDPDKPTKNGKEVDYSKEPFTENKLRQEWDPPQPVRDTYY
jgi:type VI secretion system secreted protein VgrG